MKEFREEQVVLGRQSFVSLVLGDTAGCEPCYLRILSVTRDYYMLYQYLI